MRQIMLATFVALGCGGSTDYLGESPDEAGADLADTSCDAAFDCGVLMIDCGTPNTATRISGEQAYGSRSECEMDLTDSYTDLFAGCALANLTDSDRDTLNDCLNSGSFCPAESDFQAIADAVCSGDDPPGITDACRRSSSILSRCFECIDNPC
jgi:hypothetical protein